MGCGSRAGKMEMHSAGKPKVVLEKCKKCSLCARNCPVSCIKGEVGKTVYEIDQSRCIKCGMCQSSCRFNAIEKR